MTLEDTHKEIAAIAGQLSLTLVRRRMSPAKLRVWAEALRRVADALEAIAGPGK